MSSVEFMDIGTVHDYFIPSTLTKGVHCHKVRGIAYLTHTRQRRAFNVSRVVSFCDVYSNKAKINLLKDLMIIVIVIVIQIEINTQ